GGALDRGGAMGEPGAIIGGGETADRHQGRRLPQMLGEKIEKKSEIATVGGNRMRRGAALALEPGRPQPDRRAKIRGGGKARERQGLGGGGEGFRGRAAQSENTRPNGL